MIDLTEKAENILYKLEEKVMLLLADNEKKSDLVQRLQAKVAGLEQEKETNTRKLQDLLSLFDTVNPVSTEQPAYAYAAKPALVQA